MSGIGRFDLVASVVCDVDDDKEDMLKEIECENFEKLELRRKTKRALG